METKSHHIRGSSQTVKGAPHDSSVRTLLRILVEKGFAKVDSDFRPALFSAAVKREKAQKLAVGHLLKRMFGGSAESLIIRLLEDKQLSMEQLEEIKKTLSRHEKGESR